MLKIVIITHSFTNFNYITDYNLHHSDVTSSTVTKTWTKTLLDTIHPPAWLQNELFQYKRRILLRNVRPLYRNRPELRDDASRRATGFMNESTDLCIKLTISVQNDYTKRIAWHYAKKKLSNLQLYEGGSTYIHVTCLHRKIAINYHNIISLQKQTLLWYTVTIKTLCQITGTWPKTTAGNHVSSDIFSSYKTFCVSAFNYIYLETFTDDYLVYRYVTRTLTASVRHPKICH